MSRYNKSLLLLVLVVSLLASCCVVHGKQTKATPASPFSASHFPNGVTGAESLAFDRRGQGPYAGVSDGRVLKYDASSRRWATFAYNINYEKNPMCNGAEAICGRPLGLQFHARTGDLYIADAYLGLMKVGPGGGEATVLASEADGVPFNFVNGVDVDQVTGDVYFTDSSTTYTREHNTMILINRDTTGRLLKYDVRRRSVTVLRSGLPYPNGVAVSADRTHVVAFRYWLKGPKAGHYEFFADLPGYADNIRRDAMGGYWFALNREDINTTSPEHLVGVCVDAKGVEHQVMTAPEGVRLATSRSKIAQCG
ncbi:hypothetical protein HU200_003810 [Digitaria exilis]|uniref:Strictosidine synthase conserved region domain-containing protein n=1 Tax=Digitaria exilis TaxID=1010633 RepID=A0A835KVK6_9POAL|nr:hypothetical protein HU200_003810 [Digitaria exilis]